MVKILLSKGVAVTNPPTTVPPFQNDLKCHEIYRQSPFIIQAACAGNKEIM